MTRKAFNAAVEAAAKKSIPGVISVGKGEDDGHITILFTHASTPAIEIGLVALDVSGYPSENTFMIFTQSSEVPEGVDDALEALASVSVGMEVSDLITRISQRLRSVLATGSQAEPFHVDDSSDVVIVDDEGEELADGDDVDDNDDEDDQDYDVGFLSDDDGFADLRSLDAKKPTTSTYHISLESAAILNRRIREDLRAVKFAGFKLGILSGLKAESKTGILSISIRVSKLGLSEEVLQAWDLDLRKYLVLLVRYAGGYKSFQAVISEPTQSLDIQFRIGVCSKYKPTPLEALSAFTEVAKSTTNLYGDDIRATHQGSGSTTGFNSLFISSSLNQLLNSLFIPLLKIRNYLGIGWDGAKLFHRHHQGRFEDASAPLSPEYYQESNPVEGILPEMMYADHLTDAKDKSISLPLVLTQFAMRYLVRCTQFCLVCHDRLTGEFEALKPYVCDKPLCLYQYMSLGFGPSIEHEILTQPFVVDLLVSFCYVATVSQRIREYPTGMNLLVPPVPPYIDNSLSTEVKYDKDRHEIIFSDGKPCRLRVGDWILITQHGCSPVHHRVMDTSLYPTVRLSGVGVTRDLEPDMTLLEPENSTHPVEITGTEKSPFTPGTTPPVPAIVIANMALYDRNFDDMNQFDKAQAISMLLDTLPSIKELRAYLVKQSRQSVPDLRTWQERISPAALGLLRWIIASNRSCIVQVDKCPGQEATDPSIRLEQKCSNVSDNWVQFRFAQGAPDKEQRFLNALRTEKQNLDPRYPTLFAFHGSPLGNWHSIIRHGLDFNDTLHGRAYGHGVYHALDQSTSIGYTSGLGAAVNCWSHSDLKIHSAMSLNEIVNCPGKFISSNPFVVVQHVAWIQCRYILVQVSQDKTVPSSSAPASSNMPLAKTPSGKPSLGQPTPGDAKVNETSLTPPLPTDKIDQDPKYTAKTTSNRPIGVPKCAISVSRAVRSQIFGDVDYTPAHKKRRHARSNDQLTLKETTSSDSEDLEDINFLFSDDESLTIKGKLEMEELAISSSAKTTMTGQTDFVPGSLDQSALPLLAPPSYATPSATLRLNRELQAILKVQKSSPLHELGWYIDVELVSNVYQWIVELHSFEPKLPLAQDMKAAGVTSIVLEIRFGKDYPHSPPFVRVIRPRFLPFTRGGGGHVTGGGAMCMELLTNSGWSAVSSIESVLLQVRMAIMNLEPKPARLESTAKGSRLDYGTGEAMQAYIRACQMHGWQIPQDFKDFEEVTRAGPSDAK